jgi:hypothetical protein
VVRACWSHAMRPRPTRLRDAAAPVALDVTHVEQSGAEVVAGQRLFAVHPPRRDRRRDPWPPGPPPLTPTRPRRDVAG